MRFVTILVLSILLGACSEAKVTDPNDPRFDPMQFDFNDYRNYSDLALVLNTILPYGTEKQVVEDFVESLGHAHRKFSKHYKELDTGFKNSEEAYSFVQYEFEKIYFQSCLFSRGSRDTLIFDFDEAEKLISIRLRNGRGTFTGEKSNEPR